MTITLKFFFFNLFVLILSDVFTGKVAFHAVCTENIWAPNHGDRVICNRVFYNASDGYDSATGVFTVPISGVYCFLATSTPGDKPFVSCYADIMLDDLGIVKLFAYGRGKSTAHAVVYARAGQKVFVKYMRDNNHFEGC